MAATRRLAAVLAADAVGYSRLIGADEQGTLDRLRAIRAEIVDASVAAHNGRIVKTTGDGFLAEFGSTVDALRCASEIQTQTERRPHYHSRTCRGVQSVTAEDRFLSRMLRWEVALRRSGRNPS